MLPFKDLLSSVGPPPFGLHLLQAWQPSEQHHKLTLDPAGDTPESNHSHKEDGYCFCLFVGLVGWFLFLSFSPLLLLRERARSISSGPPKAFNNYVAIEYAQ